MPGVPEASGGVSTEPAAKSVGLRFLLWSRLALNPDPPVFSLSVGAAGLLRPFLAPLGEV